MAHRPDSGRVAVQLAGLTKEYRGVRVLDAIDAEFHSGDVVHIAGSNGAGKSTLSKSIAGLLRPTSGKIVLGRDQSGRPGRTAICLEEPTLYSGLSVRDCLDVISGERSTPESEAGVDLYGIGNLLRKRASRLSFGQRRRVTLVATLRSKASVVLFDDPLNGLDDEGIVAFGEQCRLHSARGQSVLVTGPAGRQLEVPADVRLELFRGKLTRARDYESSPRPRPQGGVENP